MLGEHWYDVIFRYFKKSLAGVTFKVYAGEDIVSPDGLDTLYYEKDQLVEEIVTNDEGIAKLEELPLGKYYVKELDAPDGYVSGSATERIDIDASYSGQDTAVLVFDDLIFQNQFLIACHQFFDICIMSLHRYFQIILRMAFHLEGNLFH